MMIDERSYPTRYIFRLCFILALDMRRYIVLYLPCDEMCARRPGHTTVWNRWSNVYKKSRVSIKILWNLMRARGLPGSRLASDFKTSSIKWRCVEHTSLRVYRINHRNYGFCSLSLRSTAHNSSRAHFPAQNMTDQKPNKIISFVDFEMGKASTFISITHLIDSFKVKSGLLWRIAMVNRLWSVGKFCRSNTVHQQYASHSARCTCFHWKSRKTAKTISRNIREFRIDQKPLNKNTF